jgi:hypothetical protein
VEEQRDTQYSHLVSALSQLDESCKSLSGGIFIYLFIYLFIYFPPPFQLLEVTVKDMEQMNEAIQGKVSKVAVANALKKRVSHEELDVAVQRILSNVYWRVSWLRE